MKIKKVDGQRKSWTKFKILILKKAEIIMVKSLKILRPININKPKTLYL